MVAGFAWLRTTTVYAVERPTITTMWLCIFVTYCISHVLIGARPICRPYGRGAAEP